jgi:ParB-like chromosome segregation protein Spo0J
VTLRLNEITLDQKCQPRKELDKDTVNEYIERMQEGDKFPPVVVFDDGEKKWLADGFHRYEASKLTGFMDITAEVKEGSRRDAILYSVQANADHGKRRTNADKRKAVMTLLNDLEWSKWSDREIAKRCLVSNRFVSNLRNLSVNRSQITSEKENETIPQQTERKVIRNGVEYTQDVSNIGKTSNSTDSDEEFEDEELDEKAKEFFDKPPMPLPDEEDDVDSLEDEEYEDEFEEDPEFNQPLKPIPQKTELQKREEKIRNFKNEAYKFGSAMFQYFNLLKELKDEDYSEKMLDNIREINDYFALIFAALKRAKGGEHVA